jgi:predicted ABC-type ATPase
VKPQLWVFAGPNGAGKSTLVDCYVAHRLPVVNPDNIAKTLPAELQDTQRVIHAGRSAVTARRTFLAEGTSFAIETTLTGRSELDLMRAASAAGYKVNLVYIGLGDVSFSIGRVRSRVASGGHDVPLQDLLRRFSRSVRNLPTAMQLAERVLLFDNSSTRLQLIFSREKGRVKFRSATMPQWVQDIL